MVYIEILNQDIIMANGINAPYGMNAYQNLSGNADITKLETFTIAPNTASIFSNDPVVMSQWDAGAVAFIGVAGTIIPLSALSPAAAATAQIVGYLVSVEYSSPNNIYTTKFPFWAAGTLVTPNAINGQSIVAYVNIDPDVMMQVQVSTSGNSLNDTVFLNSWLNYSGALSTTVGVIANPGGSIPANYVIAQNPGNGNPAIGSSTYYLDGSTLNAAVASGAKLSTGNFKVMGVVYPTNVFNVGNQNVVNAGIINNLVVGVSMPFTNVYGKFNNHMYATGTANPTVILPSTSGTSALNGVNPVQIPAVGVTAFSYIQFSRNATPIQQANLMGVINITAINAGVSFTVQSTIAGDIQGFSWKIVTP